MATFLQTINVNAVQGAPFSTTIVPPATYKLSTVFIVDSAGVGSTITVPQAQELSYLLSLPLPPQKVDVCVIKAANFENLVWAGFDLPNKLAPFSEDSVGFDYSGDAVNGARLLNTNGFLKLKAGNDESIIEFYYFSNTFLQGDRVSTMIEFQAENGFNRSFGITRSNHCFGYGALLMAYLRHYESLFTLAYLHAYNYCNSPDVLFPGLFYQIDIPYIDTSRMGQTYPKTKFKMRMINGIYELYKNDVLVGSVPYDNTVNYNFVVSQLGNRTVVNVGIQLLKVEGNFE